MKYLLAEFTKYALALDTKNKYFVDKIQYCLVPIV